MISWRKSHFLTFISLFMPLAAPAACDPAISFEGATPSEMNSACASLGKVTQFYKQLGMVVQPPQLRLVFADQVFLPLSATGGAEISVHGYFDTDDNSIHLVHFEAPSQKERRPWDLAWTPEMATSFLLHEMTHLVNIAYMGKDFRRLPRHWQEFVAYAVQFELMDARLREKIVTYSSARAWNAPTDVDPGFYEMAPELFALKAHLSLQKWGGPAFLKKLVDGEVPLAKNGE